MASLHLHGRGGGKRESNQHAPASSSPQSPPPGPCTPQPANAAALCIAVPLFQITSSRVRDLHPDGEVVAIAGGASLGVLVLWPWEWPWGRPWRRPAVGAAAGAPDSLCEINCMSRAGAAFPVVPTWLPSGFSFLCGRAVLARADGHLRQQRGPKCHSGC